MARVDRATDLAAGFATATRRAQSALEAFEVGERLFDRHVAHGLEIFL